MDVDTLPICRGAECWVSRSGYTGEDGYEISIPIAAAETVARALLAHDDVEFIGLGARDSLTAGGRTVPVTGMTLMRHTTTPTSASLNWAMQKARRTDGKRAGGFPGADIILRQMENGAPHRRVGLRPIGTCTPMREGVEIFAE